MGLRWLTASISIPVVLAAAWFGGWWVFLLVTLVVVMGTYELHAMMLHSGHHPIIPISLALSVLFLLAAMFPQKQLVLLESGVGVALLVSFVWLFFRKHLDGAMVDWALTLAIAVYLGWPMSFLVQLRGSVASVFRPMHEAWFRWVQLPTGLWWLLAVLLGVWGFDSAAFFVGRYLGRHKLAPAISPAKSWEGVAGGLVVCIAATLLCTTIPLGVPWYLAVVLGVLIGAAATAGDLAESLIKRQTQVKDSGQIMPGHGGMLDRIDSLLFAAIVVYIFAQVMGFGVLA